MSTISRITVIKDTLPGEVYDEYESFRNQFKDLYIKLLNQKIFQKNTKLLTSFILKFSSNEEIISSFEIKNSNYFTEKKLLFTNNTLLKSTPRKEIRGYLLNIHNRLLELWNTSSSFEEIEFLLFHINNMPSLGEVKFETRSNMLKMIDYLHLLYPQSIRGIDRITTNERFKIPKPDLDNNENYHELEDLVASYLVEDDPLLNTSLYNDNEKLIDRVIAFWIEILGYATKSTNGENLITYGIIGLNLELLKNFNTKIETHSLFNHLKEIIFKCYGYKITKKDFVFESILEKVFYHEFGHLYFGHCNSSSIKNGVKNPNTTRESFANFFASLIFNNQQKSTLIWLQTRFQPKEYQRPILVKVPESYNDLNNLKCNFDIKTFKKHCEEEQYIRFRNSGLHL